MNKCYPRQPNNLSAAEAEIFTPLPTHFLMLYRCKKKNELQLLLRLIQPVSVVIAELETLHISHSEPERGSPDYCVRHIK